MHVQGFPDGSDGKASACNAGDPGSIPGLGRSPGEGNGNPLQNLERWYQIIYLQGSNGEVDIENSYGHGECRGEGEMCGKSNMESYITICKIDSQWEFAVWLRKLKRGLCINEEEWDGVGNGRDVSEGEIYEFLWLIHVEV